MAPPKSRVHAEDSRAENLSVKERNGAMHTGSSIRGRRTTQQQTGGDRTSFKANATNGSAVASTSIATGEGIIGPGEGSKISWTSEDHHFLQTYRNAYRINSPAAFKLPLSHIILGNSAIGRQSPTMARAKSKRRVSSDQLALAIRRNFNALAVNENDVVANLLYTIRPLGCDSLHLVLNNEISSVRTQAPDNAGYMAQNDVMIIQKK